MTNMCVCTLKIFLHAPSEIPARQHQCRCTLYTHPLPWAILLVLSGWYLRRGTQEYFKIRFFFVQLGLYFDNLKSNILDHLLQITCTRLYQGQSTRFVRKYFKKAESIAKIALFSGFQSSMRWWWRWCAFKSNKFVRSRLFV